MHFGSCVIKVEIRGMVPAGFGLVVTKVLIEFHMAGNEIQSASFKR